MLKPQINFEELYFIFAGLIWYSKKVLILKPKINLGIIIFRELILVESLGKGCFRCEQK